MKSIPWICAVLFSLVAVDGSIHADELKVGFASIDITPPIGYRMSGYFFERPSTGTKDPLLAKAIYFEQGSTKAAIVSCDLIGVPLDLSQRARAVAERELGLPKANVSIMATHSHTGPLYSGVLREHFHRLAIAANNGQDPREEVDYPAVLATKLVEVLREAQRSATPMTIAAGFAEETRLSFNRRFHMRDGTVRFNPGQQNPDIIRVAGPIDPQVGLVAFRSANDGNLRAAFVAFALHLDTVGGTEYSGDYPKVLQDVLKSSFGDRFLSVFAAGTCGDINHVDVSIKGRRSAQEIGTLLAETVSARLPKLQTAEPKLAVKSAIVEVPLQRVSTEKVEAARAGMVSIGDSKIPFLTHVENCKVMAIDSRKKNSIGLEVHVFRLTDDAAIVTLPGEVFVELGMAIKQKSPFRTTIVAELADDSPAYIPTTKAFGEGSYETVNSIIETGGGEVMVETAVQLLNQLK